MDSFTGIREARAIDVDLLTDSFRVSGTVRTPFDRVADLLNQPTTSHLTVEHATISEHADPSATQSAHFLRVDLAAILVLAAPALAGSASAEMKIPKRPVRVQLALPPIRCTGIIHVAVGSRPVDGLLNLTDHFIAMTDVSIDSGAHPQLARSLSVVAVARGHAQLMLVIDDERPDELLADVLDERTAERWLRIDDPGR